MSLETNGNITSKLVQTLARGVVANSAYLTRGAVGVPGIQPGMRAGQSYQFVMNNITANDFSGATGTCQEGVTYETAELGIKSVGTAIAPAKLEKALAMEDFKSFTKEVAPAIANKFALDVAAADIQKIDNVVTTGTAQWKKIAAQSAKLKAKWQGKQFGFASPEAIAQMQSEGRNIVPVNVEAGFGVGLEGKLFNIDELRTMNLPETVNSLITAAKTVVVGETISLSGIKAGEFVVGASGAVAVGTDDGVATGVVAGALATTDASKTYAPVIIRAEGAQAWEDCAHLLDGMNMETSDSVEGVKVVMEKREGTGSFSTKYNFAVSGCAGIADKKKAVVVWVEIA